MLPEDIHRITQLAEPYSPIIAGGVLDISLRIFLPYVFKIKLGPHKKTMKSFRITLTIWFQKEKFGRILQLFLESRKMKGNFLRTLHLSRIKLLVAGSPPLNWCMETQPTKYCRSTRLLVWITEILTVVVKRFLLIGSLITHGLDLNYSNPHMKHLQIDHSSVQPPRYRDWKFYKLQP